MKKIIIAVIVILVLSAFGFFYFKNAEKVKNNSDQLATENQENKERNKNDLPEASLGNPASIYCIENGGKLEIRKNQFGEVGYCIFDDNSECEEWAFYQGECQNN